MSVKSNLRIDPSEVSPEILRQLEVLMRDGHSPALVGPTGEQIELPEALNDVLTFVLESMKRKQSVLFMPEETHLTTQSAAQILGMSRPYLLRLLDAGKIPFKRVGTHRRITLRDVRAYQALRDAERHERLDALTKAVDEAGVYDRF